MAVVSPFLNIWVLLRLMNSVVTCVETLPVHAGGMTITIIDSAAIFDLTIIKNSRAKRWA